MAVSASIEWALAEWAASLRYEDLPSDVVAAVKLLTRTVFGTAVAGATADGCEETVSQVKEWGGRPEATIWIHGGKAPVHAATMANSMMARALDICDATTPGQHIGTSAVPVALGMAELVGGIDGRSFITALAAGCEIAARLGRASRLDGFDPTGACSIFAPCVVAGYILQLTPEQMLNAMALTFNRAGSSFQSNIDASLAVRLIEGFISQNGVMCAQLAKKNLTGPKNWLTGVWGYYHLFCKDERSDDMIRNGLGDSWSVTSFGYKTRPQCGATISSTDAILSLLAEHPFEPEDVDHIDIQMASSQTFHLVGSEFEIGDNPQVSGQFSIGYCVANAIARKGSSLAHFTNEAVSDPRIGALARRIRTHLTPALAEGRRELGTRVALSVHLNDGRILTCGADRPSGFAPWFKTAEDHLRHFEDHMAYGGRPLMPGAATALIAMTEQLDEISDVRLFAPMLVSAVTTR